MFFHTIEKADTFSPLWQSFNSCCLLTSGTVSSFTLFRGSIDSFTLSAESGERIKMRKNEFWRSFHMKSLNEVVHISLGDVALNLLTKKSSPILFIKNIISYGLPLAYKRSIHELCGGRLRTTSLCCWIEVWYWGKVEWVCVQRALCECGVLWVSCNTIVEDKDGNIKALVVSLPSYLINTKKIHFPIFDLC